MSVLRTGLRRTPLLIMAPLWRHRDLIRELVIRDLAQRYRGSLLGWLWAALNPLLMLAVYTFVFGYVFQARWGGGGEPAPARREQPAAPAGEAVEAGPD